MLEQSKALPYQNTVFALLVDNFLFGAMSSHRIGQTSETFIPTTRLYPSPTAPALVRSCNRVSLNATTDVPHCIAAKRKKPHKSLCGLGSWREQQQTIEKNQKFACCQARPHRNLWGFVFRSSPDATQTIWLYTFFTLSIVFLLNT